MKKILFVFAVISLFVSCSDGSSNSDGENNSIPECQWPEVEQPAMTDQGIKKIITVDKVEEWAEEPSDLCIAPTEARTVQLRFRDLNDNGELDDYEDWRLTPDERAADLIKKMNVDEKLAMMAHADLPEGENANSLSGEISAAMNDAVSGTYPVRFFRTGDGRSSVSNRASWANSLQRAAESTSLGIPCVLSVEPCHGYLNVANGFSQWPNELGMAATGDAGIIEEYGAIAASEYRAIGIRMALSPVCSMLTEPRWWRGQFTFGEDADTVSGMVSAYIRGFQTPVTDSSDIDEDGNTAEQVNPFEELSVACTARNFPGEGPQKDGWDSSYDFGRELTYPGNNFDYHLKPFEAAVNEGIAAVMPGKGVVPVDVISSILTGSLTDAGISYQGPLLNGLLKTDLKFSGVVLSDWGILDDSGSPWGVEGLNISNRIAVCVEAGMDQFGGLNDPSLLRTAYDMSLITDSQVNISVEKILLLMFKMGIFENPYVDDTAAKKICNSNGHLAAARRAMTKSIVVIENNDTSRPITQDGITSIISMAVIPAPMGEPYQSPGIYYYVEGNHAVSTGATGEDHTLDMDWLNGNSSGYGTPTWLSSLTREEQIVAADTYFTRLAAPYTADPRTGGQGYSLESLEYAGQSNESELEDINSAALIQKEWNENNPSATPRKMVVGILMTRPSVISEVKYILDNAGIPYALVIDWGVDTKSWMDAMYGVGGVTLNGKLPVGLPDSDTAAQNQNEDTEKDGSAIYPFGTGINTIINQY